MGLFGKKRVDKTEDFYWTSDGARYGNLENDPDVLAMETQVTYWMGTDKGWEEFNSIFVDAPVIVAKTQMDSSGSETLKVLSDYIATQDRFELIKEGLLRAAGVGYAVAMALPFSRGYQPRSRNLDSRTLADETARIMVENSPPTDVEWFGYANRNGIWTFQTLLLPLGESATDVMEKTETIFLMSMGRWFLRYGIALAKAQQNLEAAK